MQQMLSSGTITGAGSFRCLDCDYVLTLIGSEVLADCPRCGGEDFARASLFRGGRLDGGSSELSEDTLAGPHSPAAISREQAEHDAAVAAARERVAGGPGRVPGCTRRAGEWRTVALTREWTRIGRCSPPMCASTTRPSRAGTR